MTEALRMEAAVVDKFSGPLRNLKDRLGDIKSPERLKEMHERFEGVHKSVERLTEAVKVGLTPAISGLGVVSLSISGALAGAAQAARAFSDTTNNLRHLSNETGVSVNNLRTLEALLNRVGVGADKTDGAISNFADTFRQIQVGRGSTFGWLKDADPGFAKQIHGAKSYTEALGEALNWIRRIHNEQDARSASMALFGTADMARLREMNDEEFARTKKQIEQNQGRLSKEGIESAKKYEEAISALREKMTGLSTTIGATALPVMTEMVASVSRFFEANQKPIQGGLMDFLNAMKSVDWSGIGSSIHTTLTNVNAFAEGLGGWKNVLLGIASIKIGSTVLSTATSIAALATSITALNGAVEALALPKLATFMSTIGAGGVAAGAGLAGFLAAITALIEKSHDAQRPGHGGQYAAATPGTIDADRERLADMMARRAALDADIAGTRSRSKDPEALGSLLLPKATERDELDAQIKLLEQSLKDAQTRATKQGTEEGLKKASPEAQKTIGEWFGSFFKSAFDGTGPAASGGTARLIQASLGGGGFGGGGFSIGRDGVLRPRGGGGVARGASGASGADAPFKLNPKTGGGTNQEVAAYIQEVARRNGIDPRTAIAVANSEGLRGFDPNKPDHGGDQGTSFGPFQLHYKNNIPGLSLGGMGDDFTRRTGLNARDPKTWRQQIDFALSQAAKNGWGAWHGAANTGIGRWQGIGALPKETVQDKAQAFKEGMSGFKLPRGGYWAQDSHGNPVAVGPDGQSIQTGRKYEEPGDLSRRAYPQDWKRAARDYTGMNIGAGGFLGGAQVNPEGHVTVNLHNFNSGVKANAQADGFFKSAKINRGRTMAMPGEDV